MPALSGRSHHRPRARGNQARTRRSPNLALQTRLQINKGGRSMADGSMSGFTDDKFAGVAEAFEGNLASGADVGASFCATVEGETVVDLWGGWADEAKTRPWEKDTIVNVYSTTKTMTALTALLVADRGLIDFDAPVAKYWPEFAAAGKENVKVSHLMAHSSGLSGWKE